MPRHESVEGAPTVEKDPSGEEKNERDRPGDSDPGGRDRDPRLLDELVGAETHDREEPQDLEGPQRVAGFFPIG